MAEQLEQSVVPCPIVVTSPGATSEELLATEWLVTNRLGSYASGSLAAANTRRYHGLLVAALSPPVDRIVTLSCVQDELVLPGADGGEERVFDLSTFEFAGAIRPDARPNLVEFRNDAAATFVYRCGEVELVKEIILADAANAVAVRYRLLAGPEARLRIRPFLALRDHHQLRRAEDAQQMTYLHYHNGIRVEDRRATPRGVHLSLHGRRTGFAPQPQWWYEFRYRGDLARGQDGSEDLYTPGAFVASLAVGQAAQLTASVDDPRDVNFDAEVERKRRRTARAAAALFDGADETARRLAVAADAFVVQRKRPNAHPATSILAGYHWFADWGRDAMIALPGLLLETHRLPEAGEVLRLYAEAVDDGLVPNFFNAPGEPPSFNSIDASLWLIVSADRYLAAGGDEGVWHSHLAGATERILSAYRDGTRFDIRADADGLLAGGDRHTQLTWMDAQTGGAAGPQPVTPRHGKCVEVNALWHAALRIAQRRCGGEWGQLAETAAAAFAAAFWNDDAGCLYDCIPGEQADAAIRPNQIIALALPDCPLDPQKQRSVVEVVRQQLLTPMGLRSLAPTHPAYRGRYGVSCESRDRAYHQGAVWAWLMGPFVEAWLRVNGSSAAAGQQAEHWLAAFDPHLRQAGIGTISEIFDGDPPHTPRGCIAQAWSVAEVLRAKRLAATAAAR